MEKPRRAGAPPPLLEERGRAIGLTPAGVLSWRLTRGTRIADPATTEKVYAEMREIAAGAADGRILLDQVADIVRDDIARVGANTAAMAAQDGFTLTNSTRVNGVWQKAPGGPRQISFKREVFGHSLTDDEVEELLSGGLVTFQGTDQKGSPVPVTGKIDLYDYNGKTYAGFQRARADRPDKFSGVSFTPDEIAALLAGKNVTRHDFINKKGDQYTGDVLWDAVAKKIKFVPRPAGPGRFSGVDFTPAEVDRLLGGGRVTRSDFVSKAGRQYSATVFWDAKAQKIGFEPHDKPGAGGVKRRRR